MLHLLEAAEGVSVLRQALSALQKIRQSSFTQRQPVRTNQKRAGRKSAEDMPGTTMQPPLSCEGFLQQACPTDAQERQNYQIRRLTPLECEFLMGLPRNYTLIPYGKRGQLAKDSPRYRAIGNSFAIPVVRWIGERIQRVNAILKPLPVKGP